MNPSRITDEHSAMSEHASERWRIVGVSVRGAAHKRVGLPNQDAIHWHVDKATNVAILAVADGHGSRKCFRSDRGAKFAVDVGTGEVAALVRRASALPTLTAIKRLAEESWPREIVRLWSEQVNRDLLTEPFEEKELAQLETSENAGARQSVEKNPLLAYGATLLTIVVTDEYTIYLQIGDGDIILVSESGEVTRPMVVDTRLFANETTSLCTEDAWREFRFTFQAANGVPPALILCSTDGYAGSFRTEKDFLKVGSDLLDLVRTEGLDIVDNRIPTWLDEASRVGSGDDVTLGMICRADVSYPVRQDLPSGEAVLGDDRAVSDQETVTEGSNGSSS
jgi:serine/threonine protein phosphatase PrpC